VLKTILNHKEKSAVTVICMGGIRLWNHKLGKTTVTQSYY